MFNPLFHLKNLKRLGVKGVQSTTADSPLLQTKELIQSHQPESTDWKDAPQRVSFHLKQLVGFRTLKTGLAILVALWFSQFNFVSNAFYVAMGTVFALQSTVKNSFVVGKERLAGTIIGGLLGFLFVCLPWNNMFWIASAAILTIVVCNQFKLTNAIVLSLTICLSILIGIGEQHPLVYSFFRMTDTAIGLMVGILVNYFVARPDYSKPLFQLIDHFEDESYAFCLQFIHQENTSLTELKNQLQLLDQMTGKYLEDTVRPTLQTHLIQELLDACHDLRFHLKGLYLLREEGHFIERSDRERFEQFLNERLLLEEVDISTLTWQSELLVAHHLNKILTHFQLIAQLKKQL